MQVVAGRWDLTVVDGAKSFPSWVELLPTGGRFVGKVGSARPLSGVEIKGDLVEFQLPPQYEGRKDNLVFNGRLSDGKLSGSTTLDNGIETTWSGVPAPALPSFEPTWGAPIELIGNDLSNWMLRSPDWVGNWSIEAGQLVNTATGSDLVTLEHFTNFRLIAEYRYPKGSNSGIYLRGRYEFQILDDFESGANSVGSSAAIYGFLAPTKNAIRPAEEWNIAEITLLGRFVTVILNDELVIDNQEIPGITGGALESNESDPGPLFLQGDHGPVTFRKLTLYPT